MLVNIENRADLVRDIGSGAVLNTDKSEYENYKNRRELMKSQKSQIDANTSSINNLEAELQEIKSLLKQLLDK